MIIQPQIVINWVLCPRNSQIVINWVLCPRNSRFDLKLPTETTEEFNKRLNSKALDEDEDKPAAGGFAGWALGSARNKGSLHSDTWTGTAADLAERGAIGIYPVSGWWKDQPKRDRSKHGARYALIVTIETDAADVDIWTPVAQEIAVQVGAAEIEFD